MDHNTAEINYILTNSLHSDLQSANNTNSFELKIKNKFFKDLQNQENSPYGYY